MTEPRPLLEIADLLGMSGHNLLSLAREHSLRFLVYLDKAPVRWRSQADTPWNELPPFSGYIAGWGGMARSAGNLSSDARADVEALGGGSGKADNIELDGNWMENAETKQIGRLSPGFPMPDDSFLESRGLVRLETVLKLPPGLLVERAVESPVFGGRPDLGSDREDRLLTLLAAAAASIAELDGRQGRQRSLSLTNGKPNMTQIAHDLAKRCGNGPGFGEGQIANDLGKGRRLLTARNEGEVTGKTSG